jgi:hypothetical protein
MLRVRPIITHFDCFHSITPSSGRPCLPCHLQSRSSSDRIGSNTQRASQGRQWYNHRAYQAVGTRTLDGSIRKLAVGPKRKTAKACIECRVLSSRITNGLRAVRLPHRFNQKDFQLPRVKKPTLHKSLFPFHNIKVAISFT